MSPAASADSIPAAEDGEVPEAVLRQLLELMGVRFELRVSREGESTDIRIDAPEDEGLLIGRRGQTLDAIRHVAQRIVAAKQGRHQAVNIDVGDYRARREEALPLDVGRDRRDPDRRRALAQRPARDNARRAV